MNESDTLTQLVHLGTNLSAVEKNQEAATHLLKVDFETGVKPYLEFLLRHGVSEGDLGTVLTRNPGLLMEDLDDLEVRSLVHVFYFFCQRGPIFKKNSCI